MKDAYHPESRAQLHKISSRPTHPTSSQSPTNGAIRIHSLGVFHGPRGQSPAVELASVGRVEVHVAESRYAVPGAHHILLRLIGDGLVDICADAPAAEGVQVLISLNGGNFGAVVVVIQVRCANKILMDSVADRNSEDLIQDAVDVILSKLMRTRVLFMKFLLFSSRSRKLRTQVPAVVTEVSWPPEVMLGVMNIHCGRVSAARSLANIIMFLILARRSGEKVTES